ncbi:MAG: flavin reductase family protein [Anaerolineales bacterium]
MDNTDIYKDMEKYTRSGEIITLTDRVLDLITTGVYVITTRHQDDINGMTAAMVLRISGKPYYVMTAIWHQNYSNKLIEKAGCFAVNILHENQIGVAKHFGRQSKREVNKFKRQDIYWESKKTGSPILLDALAYLDCCLVDAYDPPKGDHTLFIGEVVEANILRDLEPLIYRRGDYPYRVIKKNKTKHLKTD